MCQTVPQVSKRKRKKETWEKKERKKKKGKKKKGKKEEKKKRKKEGKKERRQSNLCENGKDKAEPGLYSSQAAKRHSQVYCSTHIAGGESEDVEKRQWLESKLVESSTPGARSFVFFPNHWIYGPKILLRTKGCSPPCRWQGRL